MIRELLTRIKARSFLLPTYIKNLVSLGYGNYLFLSPPFINKQYLLSRLPNSILSYTVSSSIHLKTAIQIFADEEYGDSYGRLKKIYLSILGQKKTPLIFDIGANIGLAALYFNDQYPRSQIHCVEPDIENYNFLFSNTYSHSNISTLQAGISSSSGFGVINNPSATSWSRTISTFPISPPSTEHENSFPVLSLDDFIASRFDKLTDLALFILKIDIEGAEADLFSIPSSFLDQFPVIFIETHDFMYPNTARSTPVLQTLSKLNRDFLISGENILSISNRHYD